MTYNNIPRVLIAGSGSGCGKTTITCALLSALKQRKHKVTAFKCGPDYIDPMFHSEILGTKSRNLDVFLCDEDIVKYLLARDSNGSDIAVIEGVMGIYDGIGFDSDKGSANHIARLTNSPEILVLNVSGKGMSLAAEAKGYLEFTGNNIAGFILNNCSEGMYDIYAEVFTKKLGKKCYGYMPHVDNAEIGSRHLGLITAAEIDDLKDRMEVLGRRAEASLDIDGLIALAEGAHLFNYEEPRLSAETRSKVRIAIARDKAFCFYYEDSLELLEHYGAELVPFSPLTDSSLPEGISGVILGGGYPEIYVYELSENKKMLESIRYAVESGVPVYAECGGFMYLGQSIREGDISYSVVGAIPGNSGITNNLVRFGYKTLTADRDNLMCEKGDSIRCHEFHYSDTDAYGDGFTAENNRGQKWKTIYATDTIFAGYPHLHLWSNVKFAESFVEKCRYFDQTVGGQPWK